MLKGRFLFILLAINSDFLLADKLQVATVTVREQNSLVREILAEITAPRQQTIAAVQPIKPVTYTYSDEPVY